MPHISARQARASKKRARRMWRMQHAILPPGFTSGFTDEGGVFALAYEAPSGRRYAVTWRSDNFEHPERQIGIMIGTLLEQDNVPHEPET